jgi:hypothetical protein
VCESVCVRVCGGGAGGTGWWRDKQREVNHRSDVVDGFREWKRDYAGEKVCKCTGERIA